MTIAAGFVCSDGILLASDTLYSNTGMGLRHGRKFWVLEHGDVVVVFGGAGMEAAMLRTRDEIDRKLKPGLSRIRVVDTVDAALKKVHDKLPDHPDFKTNALVAIQIQGQGKLYENAGGSNMISPVQHPCQCVGYGQSLGWYFASSLFRPGMPIKSAKIVAAHLVRNVKDYSEYCGGETHLIEVPEQGSSSFIDDKSEVEQLELYLRPVSESLQMVLPGSDPGASAATIEARLRILNDAIRKARTNIVLAVGPVQAGALALQGHTVSPLIRPTAVVGPPNSEGQSVHQRSKHGRRGRTPSQE
jgi:hypothetical protein